MENPMEPLSEKNLAEIYEAILNNEGCPDVDSFMAIVDGKLCSISNTVGLIPVKVSVHGFPVFKSK